MAGPRSRSDKVRSSWDDGGEHQAILLGRPRGPMSAAESHELARLVASRTEMLGLLALGAAFQFRLAGAVAAAWSGERRPPWRAAAGTHGGARRATGPSHHGVAGYRPRLGDSGPAGAGRGSNPGDVRQWGRKKSASSAALRLACLGLGVRPRGRGWSPRCGRRAARLAARPGPRAPRAWATPVHLDVVATDDASLPHWAIIA